MFTGRKKCKGEYKTPQRRSRYRNSWPYCSTRCKRSVPPNRVAEGLGESGKGGTWTWEQSYADESASTRASQPNSSGKKDEATVKVLGGWGVGGRCVALAELARPRLVYHALGQGFTLREVRDLFLLSDAEASIKVVQYPASPAGNNVPEDDFI